MNAVSSPTSRIIIAVAARALALVFSLIILAAIIALPLACVDNSAADLAGSAEAFPLEVEAFTRRPIW